MLDEAQAQNLHIGAMEVLLGLAPDKVLLDMK